MIAQARLCLIALTAIGCFANFAEATLPVVDRLEPLGVVRGVETTVILHGQRVGDARQVLTDLPGIEILSVKPLDCKRVEVKLKADAKLNPGLYLQHWEPVSARTGDLDLFCWDHR